MDNFVWLCDITILNMVPRISTFSWNESIYREYYLCSLYLNI